MHYIHPSVFWPPLLLNRDTVILRLMVPQSPELLHMLVVFLHPGVLCSCEEVLVKSAQITCGLGNTAEEKLSFTRNIPEEKWIPTHCAQTCTQTCKAAGSEARCSQLVHPCDTDSFWFGTSRRPPPPPLISKFTQMFQRRKL